MFNNNIYVIDLETTGNLERIQPTRITEIGIAKLDKNTLEVTDTFQTYINPEEELTEWIVNYTGITNELLKDKPKFKEIADKVTNFIKKDGDYTLAAWPISFDIPVLQYEYAKAGMKFPLERRSIDIGTLTVHFMLEREITLKLSPKSETGKLQYSLSSVSYSLGINMHENEKRHSALDDAVFEARVLAHVLKHDKAMLEGRLDIRNEL